MRADGAGKHKEYQAAVHQQGTEEKAKHSKTHGNSSSAKASYTYRDTQFRQSSDHNHHHSAPRARQLPLWRMGGSASLGGLLGNVMNLGKHNSRLVNGAISVVYVFANSAVSLWNKPLPSLKYAVEKVGHAALGALVVYVGTNLATPMIHSHDPMEQMQGRALLTMSWSIGGNVPHVLEHFRAEAEEFVEEERKALLATHAQV